MTSYRYRSGDTLRRLVFLAELCAAAATGAGIYIAVVAIFSLA